jgi:hypothetical protein
MQIDIADLKRINIQPGEILVIEIDTGKMPPARVAQHLADVQRMARASLPDPNVKIWVVQKNNYTLSVVSANQVAAGGGVGNAPSDPLTDYDRAMKGLG